MRSGGSRFQVSLGRINKSLPNPISTEKSWARWCMPVKLVMAGSFKTEGSQSRLAWGKKARSYINRENGLAVWLKQ
jgi:hypothetical protein